MKEFLILINAQYWYHGYVIDFANGVITTSPVLACDKKITYKIDLKDLEIYKDTPEKPQEPKLMWFNLQNCNDNNLLKFLTNYIYSPPVW